jgi:Domain of unknown function (DUF4149)
MAWLRVASLVVLALWVGGLAVLGFVAAPAIFAALESHDPSAGRTLAGAVFGAVLWRFHYWTWILGIGLLVLLLVRSLLGPRPRGLALRMGVVVLMLAFGAVSAYYISPRIDQIRNDTGGAIASLREGDPRKVEFGRLHGLSSILMLCTLGAGISLFWAELDDH